MARCTLLALVFIGQYPQAWIFTRRNRTVTRPDFHKVPANSGDSGSRRNRACTEVEGSRSPKKRGLTLGRAGSPHQARCQLTFRMWPIFHCPVSVLPRAAALLPFYFELVRSEFLLTDVLSGFCLGNPHPEYDLSLDNFSRARHFFFSP